MGVDWRVAPRQESALDPDVREHIEAAVRGFQEILDGKLTGVYLHGSLAAGAFSRAKSDIDLLVVVESGLSEGERRRLARLLTSLSEVRPIPEDIEMSVILEDDAQNFPSSAPVSSSTTAHLSWKAVHQRQEQAPMGARTDRDLAAHCTVTQGEGSDAGWQANSGGLWAGTPRGLSRRNSR